MDYAPHTTAEIAAMLATVGVSSVDDLFDHLPTHLQQHQFQLPAPLTEPEISRLMAERAAQNAGAGIACFLGGGAYRHFIPATVRYVLARTEFYTSYTPYQAEISQGTLESIFEYQTLLARLTGLEVSNASMYDGASAVAEAALMALRLRKKPRLVFAESLNPLYRRVLHTYLEAQQVELVELPCPDGAFDLAALAEALQGGASAVIVQQPNFFGCLEEVEQISEVTHSAGALLVAVVNPISLGVLLAPGEYGADIAVGEGQPLGLPLSYGGPYFGFMTARQEYVRQMPGRIVGRTVDRDGQPGYVLTLQTREQHIRRERATSNICSNQALCALAATVYLTTLGKQGIRQVAELNVARSHAAVSALLATQRAALRFNRQFFNEFALQLSYPTSEVQERGRTHGVQPGLPLERWYPSLSHCLLTAVTELATEEEVERWVKCF